MLWICRTCHSVDVDLDRWRPYVCAQCFPAGTPAPVHSMVPAEPAAYEQFQFVPNFWESIVAWFGSPGRQRALQTAAEELARGVRAVQAPYLENYVLRFGVGGVVQNDADTRALLAAVLQRRGFRYALNGNLLADLLLSVGLQQEQRRHFGQYGRYPQTDLQAFLVALVKDYGSLYQNQLPFITEYLSTSPTLPESARIRALTSPRDALGQISNICATLHYERQLSEFEAGLVHLKKAGFKTVDDLDFIKGVAFEQFLCQLYGTLGYEARTTVASGDQGADLLLKRFGTEIVVQAKRYSDTVGNKAVQEAHAAKGFYRCNEAWVVTTNFFTRSAKELASVLGVRLIDRAALAQDISRYNALLFDGAEVPPVTESDSPGIDEAASEAQPASGESSPPAVASNGSNVVDHAP